MARIKLSPPWVTYYKELKCLFVSDKDITIIFDEDIPEIKLCVNNDEKAFALSQILPTKKEFGGVTLKITIVPSNEEKLKSEDKERISNNLYTTAFKNNPILYRVVQLDTFAMGTITYVVFENGVVQYYNDNLYDINGICSTLYQDIAKRIFVEINGVHFCTELYDDCILV